MMGYAIAVCIKPVPDPKHYDRVTIDPVSKTITRAGIPTVINPLDKHALEAALQVREQHGGTVSVFTMAPPNAADNLREALAMGADAAYLLTDRAFGGADTYATSYTLAQGLKKAGPFDLIFTGTESADGATAQVPSQLAEWLDVAHLLSVRQYAVTDKEITAQAKIENGYIEYSLRLPALLAIARDANKPRFISIMGVMKAKKRPLITWAKADLSPDETKIGLAGSPTQPGAVFTPDLGRKARPLTGSPEEIAGKILDELRTAGIAIESWVACSAGRQS